MRISSKRQMYKLLRDGKLGNTLRIWQSADNFEQSGFSGLVGVRQSDMPGAPYYHHLTPFQGLMMASMVEESGGTPVIYEAAVDRDITVQGEMAWLDGVAQLRYSRAKTHMRASLVEDNNYLHGRRAEVFLRRIIGHRSWSELVWLSLTYPEHVIEFTAFDRKVGFENLPMVVWEVRDY